MAGTATMVVVWGNILSLIGNAFAQAVEILVFDAFFTRNENTKIAGFIFYYGGAFPHFQLSRLVRNSAIRSRCFRKLRSCTYSVFSYTKADGT